MPFTSCVCEITDATRFFLDFVTPIVQNADFIAFFAKKLAYVVEKLYLCIRFRKEDPLLGTSNGKESCQSGRMGRTRNAVYG